MVTQIRSPFCFLKVVHPQDLLLKEGRIQRYSGGFLLMFSRFWPNSDVQNYSASLLLCIVQSSFLSTRRYTPRHNGINIRETSVSLIESVRDDFLAEDERTCLWTDQRTDVWANPWTNSWIDPWTDSQTDFWTDPWIDRQINDWQEFCTPPFLYSGTSLQGISRDWLNFSHRLKIPYSQYRNNEKNS